MPETTAPEVAENTAKEATENQEIAAAPSSPAGEQQQEVDLSDDAKSKIIKQLEYYFGNYNLPRDRFLRQQTELENGWVPLDIMMKFSRLAAHAKKSADIIKAMEDTGSDLLELNEGKTKIRRVLDKPLPETGEEAQMKTQAKTVYCKGFEAEAKLDDLIAYFSTFGKVESVQMRSFTQKNPKKRVFKGSVFAVFDTAELAEAFMKLESVKYKDTELIRKWQKDYFEEKKEEREKQQSEKKKKQKEDEQEVPEVEITLPTNCFLHVTDIPDETTREHIKAAINDKTGITVAYVTFEKGDKEAWARLQGQDSAIKVMESIGDSGKLSVQHGEVTVAKVSEEDEKPMLEQAKEHMKQMTQRKKQGRFGGRRGFKRRGGGRGYNGNAKRARGEAAAGGD